MPSRSEKVALVIPCYNEADRLPIDQFLQHNSEHLKYIFVDDGSSDNTYGLLSSHDNDNWFTLRLDRNHGKAEAVREGMLHARKQGWFGSLDWIGYWDADLATSLEEVERFIHYTDTFYDNADAIFGCRVLRGGGKIIRNPLRHYIGRIYVTLVDLLFGLQYYDTQCGAKLFRPSDVEMLFQDQFTSRWCFDVEIVLRIKDSTIIEYPLLAWTDIQGSRFSFLLHSFSVLIDLLKIKFRYG